jgi:mRNA-degrading endonuclease RelE of RelBE toxin-antitoxin system
MLLHIKCGAEFINYEVFVTSEAHEGIKKLEKKLQKRFNYKFMIHFYSHSICLNEEKKYAREGVEDEHGRRRN